MLGGNLSTDGIKRQSRELSTQFTAFGFGSIGNIFNSSVLPYIAGSIMK